MIVAGFTSDYWGLALIGFPMTLIIIAIVFLLMRRLIRSQKQEQKPKDPVEVERQRLRDEHIQIQKWREEEFIKQYQKGIPPEEIADYLGISRAELPNFIGKLIREGKIKIED